MINLEATFLHQALPSVCTATEGVSNTHCAKAKGALGASLAVTGCRMPSFLEAEASGILVPVSCCLRNSGSPQGNLKFQQTPLFKFKAAAWGKVHAQAAPEDPGGFHASVPRAPKLAFQFCLL